jgi:hypothetical protein
MSYSGIGSLAETRWAEEEPDQAGQGQVADALPDSLSLVKLMVGSKHPE